MTTTAPKQAESIPTVTAPVDIPTVKHRRGWFLANVITGGVFAVLDVALLIWAVSLSW